MTRFLTASSGRWQNPPSFSDGFSAFSRLPPDQLPCWSPSGAAGFGGSSMAVQQAPAQTLERKLLERTARVGVLGLGYAGLPMAVEIAQAGFQVTGLDINRARVNAVNDGSSPVSDVEGA